MVAITVLEAASPIARQEVVVRVGGVEYISIISHEVDRHIIGQVANLDVGITLQLATEHALSCQLGIGIAVYQRAVNKLALDAAEQCVEDGMSVPLFRVVSELGTLLQLVGIAIGILRVCLDVNIRLRVFQV